MQATERLVEELQSGVEALGRSLQADVIFEGVGLMAKEQEGLYECTMID